MVFFQILGISRKRHMATNVNIELEVRDEDAGGVKCAMQGKV